MEKNFLSKDMRKTMLKMFILRRIKKDKVNSYALLKEVSDKVHSKRFFYNSAEVKSELYNTIKSLENSSYIKVSKKIENGRLKNYYALTKEGNNVLESAKKIFVRNIKELTTILGE